MPAICCIRVTEETSPLVQELCFSYDYTWPGFKKVDNTEYKYLYLWSDKCLCHSDFFLQDGDVLLTFSELLEFLKTGKLPASWITKFTSPTANRG